MSSQIHHFPPDLLNLLVETIPKLCKSKKDVLTFFSGSGVRHTDLADLIDIVNRDAASISKYAIAKTILIRLNDAGDSALRERREIIKRVVGFYDFSRCWPSDQDAAIGLVARVRELVNVKDTFTKFQQSHQSNIEKDENERRQKEEERIKTLEKYRDVRRQIKSELIELYKEKDKRKRGIKLEGILNRLFKNEEILVKEAFTIKGEHDEGIIQQIDGAIEVNSHLYLVEMKWWKNPLGPGEVAQHMIRLFERSDVRGIFISASGYTDSAVIHIKKALGQRTIVLFTLKELVLLLEGEDGFEALLKSKVEAVQLEGKLLYNL